MVFALERLNSFFKYKYYNLKIITRLKYMTYKIQQNITFIYFFNFTIKKGDNINIALELLLLEVTSKRFDKKKVLFHCLNGFQI